MVSVQTEREGWNRPLSRWSVDHDVEEAKLRKTGIKVYATANEPLEKLKPYEMKIEIDQMRDVKTRSLEELLDMKLDETYKKLFKEAMKTMNSTPTPTGLTRRQKLLLAPKA